MFSSFLLFTMLLAFRQTQVSEEFSKLFFADFFALSLFMPPVFGFSFSPPPANLVYIVATCFTVHRSKQVLRENCCALSAMVEAISHVHVFFPNKVCTNVDPPRPCSNVFYTRSVACSILLFLALGRQTTTASPGFA